MWPGRKLRPALEKGTAAVKTASDSLKIILGLVTLVLIVCLVTLAAVLGKSANG